MAPIIALPRGVTPQIIDDDRLIRLRQSLEEIELMDVPSSSSSVDGKVNNHDEEEEKLTSYEQIKSLDVERFVSLLEPWQVWPFEEMVRFVIVTEIIKHDVLQEV
jgi:hypothetical protein